MDARVGELLSLSLGLEKALREKDWDKAAVFLRSREVLLKVLQDRDYTPAEADAETWRAVWAADQRGAEILRGQMVQLEGKIAKLQDMKKLLADMARLGKDQGAVIFDRRG